MIGDARRKAGEAFEALAKVDPKSSALVELRAAEATLADAGARLHRGGVILVGCKTCGAELDALEWAALSKVTSHVVPACASEGAKLLDFRACRCGTLLVVDRASSRCRGC